MKLSKEELLHASKEQLAAIGTHRSNNKGWLTRSVLADWTPEQVQRFRSKAKRATTDQQPELFKVENCPKKDRDPMPEQFAQELYEQSGRNLS